MQTEARQVQCPLLLFSCSYLRTSNLSHLTSHCPGEKNARFLAILSKLVKTLVRCHIVWLQSLTRAIKSSSEVFCKYGLKLIHPLVDKAHWKWLRLCRVRFFDAQRGRPLLMSIYQSPTHLSNPWVASNSASTIHLSSNSILRIPSPRHHLGFVIARNRHRYQLLAVDG